MSCCVCSGWCSHTGAHSYCASHSLNTVFPAVSPLPSWPLLPMCEHCYCLDASGTFPDHRQCCKCFTRMHKQFLPVTQAEKDR